MQYEMAVASAKLCANHLHRHLITQSFQLFLIKTKKRNKCEKFKLKYQQLASLRHTEANVKALHTCTVIYKYSSTYFAYASNAVKQKQQL